MESKKYKLVFVEGVLGTCPGNKEIMSEYIAANNPKGIDQAEVEAVPDVAEELQKATTFFARTADGVPMLWDYQVKGFIKDAVLAMITSGDSKEVEDKKTGKKKMVKNPVCGMTLYTYKRVIDQLVFVGPRQIPLELSGEVDFIERPLRAQTMQGERVALAKSEQAPAGTTISIEISVMRKDLWSVIDWVMEYGRFRGIGQWRNSGKGRFLCEEIEEAA